MARSRIARLFSTLPTSASSASGMAAPHKRDPDVAEGGRDRGVWLLYRGAHRAHPWESAKDGGGPLTGGTRGNDVRTRSAARPAAASSRRRRWAQNALLTQSTTLS